jgi:methyltransferase
MSLAIAVLAFVTAERLVELEISRRNTKRLMEEGAVEYAPGHYPLIVALHAAWLGGLWFLAWDGAVDWVWLGVFAVLQVLRVWVLVTLGIRWTTRIIVTPGASLVEKGPYRFVAHPNYLVVIGEIAVLPLVFGLVWYAAVFSALNAAALYVRIRAENAALAHARARQSS